MKIHITRPLFDWDAVESSPSLQAIKEFLKAVPDSKLLAMLRAHRGKGRNDYPVSVSWGVVLLTIFLHRGNINACLSELRRNPSLRELIGIRSERRVPKSWNISRFLYNLGRKEFSEELANVFKEIIGWLLKHVDSLGLELCGDGTHLSSHRSKDEKGKSQEESELPLAEGGRKEYVDEEGKVKEVFEWYGYKLLLIVDTRHEVVLGWKLVRANSADCVGLAKLLKETLERLPEGRAKSFVYDKAADDAKIHKLLDNYGVKPVIKVRNQWKEEKERLLPLGGRLNNVVYDEAGTVYCYDTVSDPPVRRKMYYMGYEPDRKSLKYICPARKKGEKCASDWKCNGDKKYGRCVRIKQELDLRRFPAIPRDSKKFNRLYKGRSAVERVNSRLKILWGAEDENITGARRFHAWISVVMIVHATIALLLASAERWEGTLCQTRLSAVAKALRSKWMK